MGRQLSTNAGQQAQHALGLVDFDVELAAESRANGFNHLASLVEAAGDGFGQLIFLIAPPGGEYCQVVALQQEAVGQRIDIAFITDDD